MKRTLISTSAIRISLGAAVCGLLAIPVACSDDTGSPTDNTEAGTGGDEGTGGRANTGGKSGGGGTSGTAGKGNGGSAGTAGGASGASGASGAGGGGKAGSAGAGGKAAGGTDGGTGPETGTPDGGEADGGDGGPPNPCPDPAEETDANVNNAKACLKFTPETITFISADPRLDGSGILIVQFYDTATPGPTTVPLKNIQYPPPSNPPANPPAEVALANLPVIPVEGLPETVYMRALFVDNLTFLSPVANPNKLLTWGMFVGGFDLTQGVLPPPPLRAVTLKKDKGTLLSTNFRALRRVTVGSIELHTGVTPADDGQGPISIGAFNVAAPSGAPVLGGAQLPCTNIVAAPVVNATAFLYTTFGQGGDFWIGAQLDDFNQGGTAKPGNLASLGGGTNGQSIQDTQKVTVAADAYAVTVPKVDLNVLLPNSTLGTPPYLHYACP